MKERNQTKLHTWLGQEEKLRGPDSANLVLCQQETQGWAPASQHGSLPNSLHCPGPAHRVGSWDHTPWQQDPQRGQTIDWGGPPGKSLPSLLRDGGGWDLHEVWGLGAQGHWGKYGSLCLVSSLKSGLMTPCSLLSGGVVKTNYLTHANDKGLPTISLQF